MKCEVAPLGFLSRLKIDTFAPGGGCLVTAVIDEGATDKESVRFGAESTDPTYKRTGL